MTLRARLSTYWCAFQEHLFPTIEQDLGPLGERRIGPGGTALARAFIGQIDTTRALRERLANDRALSVRLGKYPRADLLAWPFAEDACRYTRR